ncbi:hypothetical protein T12_15307 [Trichinella patagoniensis]|uniref:Uncharacterized protein n=1 Tax=Trichinella patagoniensis TaxID=990121 RepID=A0A0V0YVM1_9BILA|nr:hypothetical protein T12_15307 [Trichinella patagoniensis]
MKKLQKLYPARQIYAAQMIYGQISEMYFSFHELNDYTTRFKQLSIQFIAQQCAFNALHRPELATFIKGTSAMLFITQPCRVN